MAFVLTSPHESQVLMAKNFVCENKVYMDATVERFQAACTQASEYKTGIEYVVRDRAATTAALAANKKLCNCRFDALLVSDISYLSFTTASLSHVASGEC